MAWAKHVRDVGTETTEDQRLTYMEETSESREKDTVRHPLEYTCLCGATDYDNQGFHDFPSRNGWSISLSGPNPLVRMDNSEVEPETVEAFVQTWLFFGTLTEVFGISGIRLAVAEFVRLQHSDRPVITMILFRRYLEDWAVREAKADRAQYAHKYGLAMDCLMLVTGLVGDDSNGILDAAIRLEIRELIRITTRDLRTAADIIWRDSGPEDELRDTVKRLPILRFEIPRTVFPFDHAQVGWNTSLVLTRSYTEMLEDGWCPSDIKTLGPLMLFSPYETYFASTLSRLGTEHTDHSLCSENQCVMRTVDNLVYESRHVVQGHDCGHAGPKIEHVVSCLEKGGIPRLVVHKDAATGVRLTVSNNGPYVAISHVWSDGLGNARDNTLPTCQLLRLRDLAGALLIGEGACDVPIPIWIDTLCVPLERQSRKLALQSLEKVYEEAEYVLVFDAELQQLTSTRCDQGELYTRIYMSGWMRRLWKLEEGVVGRGKLRIQLLDTSIALPSETQI